MKTAIEKVPEVAIIMANTAPVEGMQIYWLISKSQVEYMLTDISILPKTSEQPEFERAQYQEEVLPVISLEKYYGLEELPPVSAYRYIVSKNPAPGNKLVKAILRLCHPVRVRKLNFNATKAQQNVLKRNGEDVLGAFILEEQQLVIIPDMASILDTVQ